MENTIVIVILAAIAGAIVWYLVRAKRKGVKCVGCSCANGCGGSCSGCHCAAGTDQKK